MSPTNVKARDFERLLKLLEVLRTHYDKIDRKALILMVECRRAGRHAEAAQVIEVRRGLRDAFETAAERIASELTTPEALRDTRRELEAARRKANGFVRDLESTGATLEKLQKALSVMTATVATITGILT